MTGATISADDHLTILNLVSRADDYATARDVDGYLGLFTEDAAIGGTEGDFRGAADLGAGVRSVWAKEPTGTHHLSCTVSVAATDRETATAEFTLLLVAGTPPTIVDLVRVKQGFARTPAGWRITSREIAR